MKIEIEQELKDQALRLNNLLRENKTSILFKEDELILKSPILGEKTYKQHNFKEFLESLVNYFEGVQEKEPLHWHDHNKERLNEDFSFPQFEEFYKLKENIIYNKEKDKYEFENLKWNRIIDEEIINLMSYSPEWGNVKVDDIVVLSKLEIFYKINLSKELDESVNKDFENKQKFSYKN